MRKELLTISQHPEMVRLDRKLRELIADTSTTLHSLKAETERKKNALWDEVEDYCRSQNLLPEDFARGEHCLSLMDGKIILTDGDDRPNELEELGKALGAPRGLMRALKGIVGGDGDDPLRPRGPAFGEKKNGTQH